MSAHVLVVEDNATNLDLITYLLGSLGYDVSCESSGIAGLKKAKETPFDLVLADILMPEMDGYEFAQRFKSDPQLAQVPLVAVTALAMTGDREKIMASGFDGYIAKPIDPQTFASTIAPFLDKQRYG